MAVVRILSLYKVNMEDKILTIQTDSSIADGDSNTRVAFYTAIGFFVEIAQMLEFNLRRLICYHKSVSEIEEGEITKDRVESVCSKYDKYYIDTYKAKFTLGRLTKELRNSSILKSDVFDVFDEINEYRITVVHKIFQNNIVVDKFREPSFVKDYISHRLEPMTEKVILMNQLVIKIIGEYQEDLHSYKSSVGISF